MERKEPKKNRFAIYAITTHGVAIARKIGSAIPDADLYVSERFFEEAPGTAVSFPLPMGPLLERTFADYECHIFIISVGAVVRMIKDLLIDKKSDPAVLCIDDTAKFCVSLLSGHIGRGNEYTAMVAAITGSIPVITTASDRIGTLMVDILGRELGWVLDDPDRNVTRAAAAVVNGAPVAFLQESGEADFWPLDRPLPESISYFTSPEEIELSLYEIVLIATDRDIEETHPDLREKSVIYRPKSLILGFGCDKGTPLEIIEHGMIRFLGEMKLSPKAVKGFASVEQKREEPGLVALSEKYGWEFLTYPPDLLDRTPGIENPSETVKRYVGTRAVAEPAALVMAGARKLLMPKRAYRETDDPHNMTMAIARIPFEPRAIDRSGAIKRTSEVKR